MVDVARFRGGEPSQPGSLEDNLHADLDDRDFTANALAAHVRTPDQVIDRHGGLADLAARVIRPVSEASIRNDPVRALRAVRLAAELDFVLVPELVELIRCDGGALVHVSDERIRDELAKLLSLPQSAPSLVELDGLGLLALILPELEPLRGVAQSAPHTLDVWNHSLETVRGLEQVFDSVPEELAPFEGRLRAHVGRLLGGGRSRLVTLKLAALLHDTGKPAMRSVEDDGRIRFIDHEKLSASLAGDALRRLRFNNSEVRLAGTVIRHHTRPIGLASQESVSPRAIYRFFRDTGNAGVEVLLHSLADHHARLEPAAQDDVGPRLLALIARMLADYYDRRQERVNPPSLIDGDNLMAELGLEPGPMVGELLEVVREAQASGQVHTVEQALAAARSHLARAV
jgi:tRNA nucleotidyltransferase/poly(A) polymerase